MGCPAMLSPALAHTNSECLQAEAQVIDETEAAQQPCG